MEIENFIEFQNNGNTSFIYYFPCFLKNQIKIIFEKCFVGKIFFYFPHNKKVFWIYTSNKNESIIFDQFIGKQFFLGFIGNESDFTIEFCHYVFDKYIDCSIYNFFTQKNIFQVHVSNSLHHLREKMKHLYHLSYYNDFKKPLLIFGLYDTLDIQVLYQHKGDIYILWGGSDIMLNKCNHHLEKLKMCYHFAISSDILHKCLDYHFTVEKMFLSFCIGNQNYLQVNQGKQKCIYIYDGLSKNKIKNNIYNQKFIDEIVPKLDDYKIYRSSETGFIPDIWNIYKNCFVALRLTNHDGNANQVQECGLLGIPCISNLEMNHCISWTKNIDEILFKIDYIFTNNIKIKFDKINVLLISSDKPGLGGGASSSYRLSAFYKKKGIFVENIYLNHHTKNKVKKEGDIYYVNMNYYHIKDVIQDKKPNIILLRTALNYKSLQYLKNNFDKIYFLCPGIYVNEMENKNIKYLHKGNYRQMNELKSYSNSILTKNEYLTYNLHCHVLEHNLLLLQNNFFSKNETSIDLLFVCSDIQRNIKNASLALDILQFFGKRNWKSFVITTMEVKNQKKYKHITFLHNIPINEMEYYYKKTKIVINTSYFDSLSNVLIEAINFGCHIICSPCNGVCDYIQEKNKFIVPDFEFENWVSFVRNKLKSFDKNIEHRKKLFYDLQKKKWEVEIKCLKLLYG